MLLRNFSNILYDHAQNYENQISKKDFRRFEKLHIKYAKADLDTKFLRNCQTSMYFNV